MHGRLIPNKAILRLSAKNPELNMKDVFWSLQIFETQRMKFSEIPQRLHALLMPPEPIIINHVIRYNSNTMKPVLPFRELLVHFVLLFNSVDPNDQKKTACYDIDVEVDDTLKTQMNSFLLSTASQQEIAGLDNKVCKNHFGFV